MLKKVIAALVLGVMVTTGCEAAELKLLTKTSLQYKGQQSTAELKGSCLKNGYGRELVVLLKNQQGQIITAFKPTIEGGYNFTLEPVHLLEGESDQVLLGAGTGNWQQEREYRIIDFTAPGAVGEIFGHVESHGIIKAAANEGRELTFTIADHTAKTTTLEVDPEGPVSFKGLSSLKAYDANKDGLDELFTNEEIKGADKVVADVGAQWQYVEDKWVTKKSTLMTAGPVPKENRINKGKDFSEGVIIPEKIILPSGEWTGPRFISKADKDLEAKVNEAIAKAGADFYEAFHEGRADGAFKIMSADKQLLSIQLISGKESFIHKHVNFSLEQGRELTLGDIFNLKDPDFLPLLELLSNNKELDFSLGLPREWYIEENKLFLVQHQKGRDIAAGYMLSNFHKFMVDSAWKERKSD